MILDPRQIIKEKPNGVVFTSGSEWLGEIGVAVKKLRSECTPSGALDDRPERIMRDVRRVWPST